jgi:hypothetical protein
MLQVGEEVKQWVFVGVVKVRNHSEDHWRIILKCTLNIVCGVDKSGLFSDEWLALVNTAVRLGNLVSSWQLTGVRELQCVLRVHKANYFGRSVPQYFESQHWVDSVNRTMVGVCGAARWVYVLGTVQCSGGSCGYQNSNCAVAALMDTRIQTVHWWLLWIWQFIQCVGGSCGYDNSNSAGAALMI